jgi:hypothetical protein
MSFFGRIVSFILNDALVKGLANSKAFQSFALKTDAMAQAAKKSAGEAATIAEQQAKKRMQEQIHKVNTAKSTDEFNIHAFIKEFSQEISGKAPETIAKPKKLKKPKSATY